MVFHNCAELTAAVLIMVQNNFELSLSFVKIQENNSCLSSSELIPFWFAKKLILRGNFP